MGGYSKILLYISTIHVKLSKRYIKLSSCSIPILLPFQYGYICSLHPKITTSFLVLLRKMNDANTHRDMVKHELRVDSLKARVKIQNCELKSTTYQFKFTSYEFKFTSSRIIKSMKTQVRLSTSRHKGILNKYLRRNFFQKSRMPAFLWRFEYKLQICLNSM